jgi:predicted TIM-barrel fold metal-dependent hydrolase
MTAFVRPDEVAAIRDRIDHPVIDSDGHLIEYLPLVRDLVVEIGGRSVAERFDQLVSGGRLVRSIPTGETRRELGLSRTAWWGVPTRNTLDRATAMLPDLMYERLDELGIDFALLYPTYGLTVTGIPDTELRRVIARAFNRYYADAYAHVRDRLEPVACIPMHTPEEAIAELDHAVGELGLKAVMMAGVVARPLPGLEQHRAARWIDTLGHDSPYDYDPVWARCVELGVAPTFHSAGMGWGSRTSTSNYVYNHIGNFAAAGEAVCRSLVLGGVPKRFPELRFAFQEGGVAWACNLYADILGHWGKRNRDAIRHYDPDALDRDLLGSLFGEYARGEVRARIDRLGEGLGMLSEPGEDPAVIDEFAASGIGSPADVLDIFTRQFHFGCEADDPMNAMAFNDALNPHGARLRGVFASDIGHWDVPDFREVLPEAWELVEDGHFSEADFADFTFANPVSLWAGSNPGFFKGTVVEGAVDRLLAGGAR